jgi:SAM-dependent MidA family methyltransferase
LAGDRPGPDTGARLRPGWRAEVNLAAIDWIRLAARRLRRGFLLIVDYGHEAHELFSATHPAGTLVAMRRHQVFLPGEGAPGTRNEWLQEPGEYDLTAHVDLSSVRLDAEAEGLETLAVLDQTYFLLSLGAADYVNDSDDSMAALKRRLALKTLLLPGGMGSTHKVMIFGKDVGRPHLRGTSHGIRLT